MEKTKNELAWIEEGYSLLAKEGFEGIQIERLARILNLNKSGFYHYFGDLAGFSDKLLAVHETKITMFLNRMSEIKILDPDCLHLAIECSTTIMFQVQLTRNQHNLSFRQAGEKMDQRINAAIRQIWVDYLGAQNDPDLSFRYYFMVRDVFYTRISFQNLNYQYLHNLVSEARDIVDQIAIPKSLRNVSL